VTDERKPGSELSEIEFTKMHGAGNDFVVLDGIRSELPPMEEFSRRIADRNFGIGCDQVLVVRTPRDPDSADFRMEIYNCDGSQVEMCGNGIRAFFKYLRDHGHTSRDHGHTSEHELRIETLGGVVRPRWVENDRVRVNMGRPVLAPSKIPTTIASGDGPVLDVELLLEGIEPDRVTISCASMGNPHAVIVVDDVDAAPVAQLGPVIENHRAFPARTNVEFIEIVGRDHIRQRTWERGVGETLACGSGACAVAVVSMLRAAVDRRVRISLRGGDLEVAWDGEDAPVLMTGPAAEVFSGRFPTRAGEASNR
jgi:diaminopimelate epimerase